MVPTWKTLILMRYDKKTALLVVDMQNDFADPGGSLYVKGGEAIVPVVNAEIEKAREAGAPVIYTQDWHPETTPHFAKDGGIWPVHCVRGSWGAQFHPDLRFDDSPLVRKGVDGKDGYSAFSTRDPLSREENETPLEAILRDIEVEHLVIVGLATDYCVKESAFDATEKGFRTTVVTDAIAAVNLEPEDGEKALSAMSEAGVELA
jgi:nicotinamidase/pyrazinamidase